MFGKILGINDNFITMENIGQNVEANYEFQAVVNLVVKYAKTAGSVNNPEILPNKKFIIGEEKGTINKSSVLQHSYDLRLEEYQAIVDDFSKTVNLPLTAEVRFDFIVKLTGNDNLIKSSYIRSMTVPLANEYYSISLSNNTEQIKDYRSTNKALFTISFFANSINIVICYIIIFLCIRGMMKAKTAYQETVARYLKTYSDLVISTDSPMSFDDYEIIAIEIFKELLDLAQNTNNPIMFYENNQGGLFYIFYNNMIYLHVVKKDKLAQ